MIEGLSGSAPAMAGPPSDSDGVRTGTEPGRRPATLRPTSGRNRRGARSPQVQALPETEEDGRPCKGMTVLQMPEEGQDALSGPSYLSEST